MSPHSLFSNVILRFFAVSEKNERDVNEDSFCADRIGDYYVFAIADGLGGHEAGEVASALAIECLKNAMKFCDGDLKETLRGAVYNACDQILAHAKKFPEKQGMATTLIAAVVDDSLSCTIVNVGDSRAHIITTNDVKTTKDHSYVNQLAERGEVKPEDIWQHPLSMVLTQALGDPDSDVTPDFYEFDLHDTFLLLSSDGLHDFVRQERIQELVLEQDMDPEKTCAALVREALGNDSDDNITVLLVHEGMQIPKT